MAVPSHSAEVAVLCRCVASLLHCRYEEEAGAAGGMMAKFLAARAKQDSRPGQSQSKKPARTLRALRTFDPTIGRNPSKRPECAPQPKARKATR